jgi:HK97 gp10 family phage protein
MNIKVTGIAELNAKLKKFADRFPISAGKALKQSIMQIERETKPITPGPGLSISRTTRPTGRLRSSIGVGVNRFGDPAGIGFSANGLTGWVGPTTNYAIFVHEGTKRMRGRPFLKQGAEKAMPMINEFFDKAIKENL